MDQHAHDLAALRREHPAYQISHEPRYYGGARYTATALSLAARPWCVVTADPAELRCALTPAGEASHGD